MKPLAVLGQPRWRLVAFLALAAGLNYADRAAMSAVLPAVRTDLGLSDVALGMLGSVFLWSYALGSPLAGHLADRVSRAKIVVGSLVAWSVVTALVGAANGFVMLLVLRIALGLAECLYLPSAIALIADRHGPETRARAMSFLSVGVNCGVVLGGSFAGFMAERHGWRAGFWVLGLGGIAFALVAKLFLPTASVTANATSGAGERRSSSFAEALRYLVGVPSYYALLLESMLSGIGVWIFLNWLPLYFRDTYGLSLGAAGFAGTFMLQISVVLGLMAGGWFSDRVSGGAPERRMLLYGLFYLAACPCLLLFLTRPSFAVVAGAIAAFSFLRAAGAANDNPTQCEIVPPQFRATGVGIMNTCSTGAGGCGVLFAGYLKQHVGLDGVFAGISGLFVIAGVVLLLGYVKFIRRDIERARQTTARRAEPVAFS